jgi:hypothetical protein
MSSISTWRSPVLLIHGDDDRNVPFHETVILVEALRKQGVPFEQLIFPDEIHGFLTERRWIEAYEANGEVLWDQSGRSTELSDSGITFTASAGEFVAFAFDSSVVKEVELFQGGPMTVDDFTFASDNKLPFGASTVPEPSSSALMLAAIALGLFVKRVIRKYSISRL